MTRRRTRPRARRPASAASSLAGLDLSGTTHTAAGTTADPWTFTDVTGNYDNASGTVTDNDRQGDRDRSW